jgi:phosphopantothenoylcysteine decarboxylase
MATRHEAGVQGPYRVPAAVVSDAINDSKKHLLLAASGSVATIKLPLIISSFENHPNLSIRVVFTKAATQFLAGQSLEQPTISSLALLPNVDAVYLDEDEWIEPWTRHSKILHIELRRWAHLLAIVPMSANLLAKATGGLCDDLLTNVIRAWDVKRAIIAAPAMNQMMWESPITAKQLALLAEEWDWVKILSPQVKQLACGDVGQGAMCDWHEIVAVIEKRLAST